VRVPVPVVPPAPTSSRKPSSAKSASKSDAADPGPKTDDAKASAKADTASKATVADSGEPAGADVVSKATVADSGKPAGGDGASQPTKADGGKSAAPASSAAITATALAALAAVTYPDTAALPKTRAGAARPLARPVRMLSRLTGTLPIRPDRTSGPRPPKEPGPGFARLTSLPAVILLAWLVPGLPILLAGTFSPWYMLLIAAPLAAAIAVNALARVPGSWPVDLPGAPAGDRLWALWFGVLATPAVAIGFTAWQIAAKSPSVIATRTPGAAFQTGYWLAQHGSLPIPGRLAAFGGAHPGLHVSSIGFFQYGHAVVPAVMSGMPMLLAAGFWTSGIGGGAVISAILGGLAILTFGGLVGRLAGRRWAPAGALALALTLPEIYTSRDAFSEPAVQVLLFGGLCLVIDALTIGRKTAAENETADQVAAESAAVTEHAETTKAAGVTKAAGLTEPAGVAEAAAVGEPASGVAETTSDDSDATVELPALAPAPASREPFLPRMMARVRTISWRQVVGAAARGLTAERMLAALGGLCLGLTTLLSLGSFAYLVPAVVAAGVLVVARRAAGLAFCVGLFVGCGYGIASAYLLARPLLDSQAPTLQVVGEDAGGLLMLTVAVMLLRLQPRWLGAVRKVVARRPLRWLPGLAALLLVAAFAALAARPYLQTVRGGLDHAQVDFVAALQRVAGLKPDPTRLYAEDTLYWVIWYAGITTVLLSALGGALLLRRILRALLMWKDAAGAALNWALPLAIVLGGTATVLWQPFTVPDQPWASRRLVPVVLPGLILLAIWAAAWLTSRARSRGAGVTTAAVVGVLCVAAMVVPSSATAFGLGLTHSGTGGGLRPTTGGLAQHRVAAGEANAVAALCAGIGRSSSVVIVDPHVAQDFSQVIRGMCGVPVASMKRGYTLTQLQAVLAGIIKAGRRPVLLGARAAQVEVFGGSASMVMNLVTTQNAHDLTQPAGAPWPARYVIWMAAASSPNVGV
jgi:hypothetical protein